MLIITEHVVFERDLLPFKTPLQDKIVMLYFFFWVFLNFAH